jgi:hypothetical protein
LEELGSRKYAMSLIGRSSIGRLGLFLQVSANLGHTGSSHCWTLELAQGLSLTVPLALLFYANRILNPAVVVIEVFVNLYVLFINRNGVPAAWKKVFPILIGLLPGIAVGAFVLASLQPGWIKLGTYAAILPLILLQAAGWRRPVRFSWLIGLPFWNGAGRPVFGNDHLRTSFSDFVQQSRDVGTDDPT